MRRQLTACLSTFVHSPSLGTGARCSCAGRQSRQLAPSSPLTQNQQSLLRAHHPISLTFSGNRSQLSLCRSAKRRTVSCRHSSSEGYDVNIIVSAIDTAVRVTIVLRCRCHAAAADRDALNLQLCRQGLPYMVPCAAYCKIIYLSLQLCSTAHPRSSTARHTCSVKHSSGQWR